MPKNNKNCGRILVIAGSDSGAGAGIQADIKTVMALGGYATTAITALTAQNTRGVFDVFSVTPVAVEKQIRAIMSDIGADCWKTGMLYDRAIIEAVSEVYEDVGGQIPLLVDPVVFAKGGYPLLEPAALESLKLRLFPKALIVTPNLPEAELLTGKEIRTKEDMAQAAEDILKFGCKAVLLKGGHLDGPIISDYLYSSEGLEVFESSRIDSQHTHGTGCTLASAIAIGIAQGLSIANAVRRGRRYLREALQSAKRLGSGSGPVNHANTVKPFGIEN